jgi:hypothetical protein
MESILTGAMLFLRHFKSLNEILVKSDEENIDILLKKPEDKVKFQHALDDLLRERQTSKTINLDDRQITISI